MNFFISAQRTSHSPVIGLVISLLMVLFINTQAIADQNQQRMVLQSIQKNILIPDSKKALDESHRLSELLKQFINKPDEKQLKQLQERFIVLMMSWKSVEALYSAGNIDEAMIDHPRYIDVFHSGNENIHKQLKKSFTAKKSVKSLLFKNSTKSINALEYVLFANEQSQPLLTAMLENEAKRLEIAQAINQSLMNYLNEIYQFYLHDTRFVELEKKSIEDLVNVLIDSSYKLLTWRVSEPAGLGDKYRGDPDSKRLEYFLSEASFLAIKSILTRFKMILNSDQWSDLAELGHSQGFKQEMTIVQKHINESLHHIDELISLSEQEAITDLLVSDAYKQLHRSLTRLHNSFYILLIEALGIQSKIIEADGD